MLKIMTLNINYYGDRYGQWAGRRELVYRAIGQSEADIVALQAVRLDPGTEAGLSQVEQLAGLLPGYEYRVFVPAAHYPDGSADGSALLSRLRFSEVDHQDLTLIPGLDDRNLRSFLHARFDLPGGPLHLFNGHFSWVEEQSRMNLDEALPFMRHFRGNALLVGDLNTTPDSPLFDRLRQEGWADAWAELHPDQPGYTFESGEPKIRIDYVWVNRELRPKLQGVEIVADKPEEDNLRASNHFGLLATFNIETGDRGEGE